MPPPSDPETSTPRSILSSAGAGELTSVLTVVTDQTRAAYDILLKAWGEVGRDFLKSMTIDGAAALQGLQRCKSPLDLIAVEQNWLLARSKAYMDAGVRLLDANLHDAEAAAAGSSPQFRLPE